MAILALCSKTSRLFSKCLIHNSRRAMSSESDVILEKIGNKGVITLNRPSALNCLNLSMVRTIYPQLKSWDSDPEIKMVIVKGSGEKAFCAGGDVRAITEACKKEDSSLPTDFFREEYQLNNLIGTLQIPYVALIHGITMGGGIGISVHGAYRVCTEKTVCAMPEAAIGFFPDVGGSYFLPKLPGKIGIYLALTGCRLQGRDVFKAGIATHFISTDSLKALEADLMRLENPTLTHIDRVLLKYQDQYEGEFRKEFSLKHVMGKMNTIFGGDSMENIVADLEKDGSEWAHKQLEIISKVSPTSLKITFELLQRGRKMTLQDSLCLDYRLSQKFMADHDFHEGVRAVLIDKDQKPTWKPARLEDVTVEKINSYFEPLSPTQELHL